MRFLTTIDEQGVERICSQIYVDYYFEKIQEFRTVPTEDGEKQKIRSTSPSDFFLSLFKDDVNEAEKYQNDLFKKLNADKELTDLQDRLEKKGIQCCMLNMYYLCEYLKHVAKCRKLFLLSPTLKDTLAELDDVAMVAFTKKDGTIIPSKSDILIKTMMNKLKAEAEESEHCYIVERVVNWDKVTNNRYIQAVFANELTEFLSVYFDIKRKKGSRITTVEQELVIYFLNEMGLSPAKVTKDRYRQLMSIYNQINFDSNIVVLSLPNKQPKLVEVNIIKYEHWKDNKINFDKDTFIPDKLEDGESLLISENLSFEL